MSWKIEIRMVSEWLAVIFGMVLSQCVFSSTESCLKSLYVFDNKLEEKIVLKNATKKSYTEPNNNGEVGELATIETVSSNGNWVTTRECKSCVPNKFKMEMYFLANDSVPCGLKNGIPKSKIISILGTPSEVTEKGYMFYYSQEDQTKAVALHIVNDMLQAVYWEYFWD